MKERPILFSGPMVRAILAGQKTQTRRVVYVSPSVLGMPEQAPPSCAATWHFRRADGKCEWHLNCKHGVPGDRLWVRETMRRRDSGKRSEAWIYDADGAEVQLHRGDPRVPEMLSWAHHKEGSTCVSIYMPRWASRLTLEIAAVRVERLQSITDADIIAEGVTVEAAVSLLGRRTPRGIALPASASAWTLRDAWRIGWSAINGVESWEANPWVWALSFAKIEGAP